MVINILNMYNSISSYIIMTQYISFKLFISYGNKIVIPSGCLFPFYPILYLIFVYLLLNIRYILSHLKINSFTEERR